MEKIYIIIECNAYDAYELPYNEQFYLTEEQAEADCLKLNRSANGDNKKRYRFFVQDLTIKGND